MLTATAKEIEDCFPDGSYTDNNTGATCVSAQWLHEFAKAIENAALKNKEPQPMEGCFVPENTYLDLLREFRMLRNKTIEECKVRSVIIRGKDFDRVLPVLDMNYHFDGGVIIIVAEA